MNLDWLQVCAEGQTTPCVAPIQLAYLVALLVGAVLLVDHRPSRARPHDGHPDPDAGRDRDQHRRRLDRGLPALADLPRFDRDRARRRARRTVGRRADRPALEPHLVDPAHPRRCRPDRRVLRAGRRGHRPDGRLLGQPRRLPAFAPTTPASAASWPSRRASRRPAVAFLIVQATIGIPDLVRDGSGRAAGQPDPVRAHRARLSSRSASSSAGWPAGPSSPSRATTRAIRPYLPGATAVAAVRARLRDPAAAVRPDRLLLDGRRRPGRRHAGRLPRRREPDRAGARRIRPG